MIHTRRGRGLGLLLGLIVALMGIGASPAAASYKKTCDGYYSNHADCTGWDIGVGKLTAVAANAYVPNNRTVICAGARDENLNWYGSLICASGRACHTYGGGNNLYARVHNHQDGDNYKNYALAYTNQTLGDCPAGGYLDAKARKSAFGSASSNDPLSAGVADPLAGEVQCLRVQDPVDGEGVACGLKSVIDAKGLIATLEPPTEPKGSAPATMTVAALPPAGATSAVITQADGSTATVSADTKTVRLKVRRGDVKLRWKGGPATGRTLRVAH